MEKLLKDNEIDDNIKSFEPGEVNFTDLRLTSWIIKQCVSIGVRVPTPIQVNCIPPILEGKDCIGVSQTGTGKTLAFVLPIVQQLAEDPYGIYALILTPTRELAFQIADQVAVIGKPMNLKHCVIVGGMDMTEQAARLASQPHIVISTPGRLMDHLTSCRTFSLSKVKYLVLDEADRLLNGQFDEHLDIIMSNLPTDRRTLLFTATCTEAIDKLKDVRDKAFFYQAPSVLPNDALTVDKLDQRYLLCPSDVKDAYLVQAVREFQEVHSERNVLIFTDTCRKCEILSRTLTNLGFDNVALHSLMSQKERLASLSKFKSNVTRIMVATDVASRGLDIETVALVVNHTVPKRSEDYVHRVGRTARAGRMGRSVTLITPYDIRDIKEIEEFVKVKLVEMSVNDAEVGKILNQVSLARSGAHIDIDEEDFFEKSLVNKRKEWILKGLDPDKEEKKLFKKRKTSKRGNTDQNANVKKKPRTRKTETV